MYVINITKKFFPTIGVDSLCSKPVSHQSYDPFAVRFVADSRPYGRSQTKLHSLCRILLNVRQLYDARTLVLRSSAGLSPDVLAELQDCQKCDRATAVRTSWVVVLFVRFLRHPCNKVQGRSAVIVRQSCGICGLNARVGALLLAIRTPCVSCSSLACLAAVLRPHQITRESQGK